MHTPKAASWADDRPRETACAVTSAMSGRRDHDEQRDREECPGIGVDHAAVCSRPYDEVKPQRHVTAD